MTFEEYLAGYHLTRTEPAKRHDILTKYWRDGRWREVILLAAGQLGVVDNRQYDAGLFLNDLRQMESTSPDDMGRPTVLAGRGLADIGGSGVNPTTRRDVIASCARRCKIGTWKPTARTFGPISRCALATRPARPGTSWAACPMTWTPGCYAPNAPMTAAIFWH